MYHEPHDVIKMTYSKSNGAYRRLQMNCEAPKTRSIWTPKTHPKKKFQQNNMMRHVRHIWDCRFFVLLPIFRCFGTAYRASLQS